MGWVHYTESQMGGGREPPLSRHGYTLRAAPLSRSAHNGCSPTRRDLSCLCFLPFLCCDKSLFTSLSRFLSRHQLNIISPTFLLLRHAAEDTCEPAVRRKGCAESHVWGGVYRANNVLTKTHLILIPASIFKRSWTDNRSRGRTRQGGVTEVDCTLATTRLSATVAQDVMFPVPGGAHGAVALIHPAHTDRNNRSARGSWSVPLPGSTMGDEVVK